MIRNILEIGIVVGFLLLFRKAVDREKETQRTAHTLHTRTRARVSLLTAHT